ncbi:MAG: UxaA family hydrolase [Casimicrobiaceae bacterium]
MSAATRPADSRWDALAIHADDDVAVALHDLAAGDEATVRRAGSVEAVRLLDAIGLGHKFALRAIAIGAPIRKYGERIGIATAAIGIGNHVHVHNLASARARNPR